MSTETNIRDFINKKLHRTVISNHLLLRTWYHNNQPCQNALIKSHIFQGLHTRIYSKATKETEQVSNHTLPRRGRPREDGSQPLLARGVGIQTPRPHTKRKPSCPEDGRPQQWAALACSMAHPVRDGLGCDHTGTALMGIDHQKGKYHFVPVHLRFSTALVWSGCRWVFWGSLRTLGHPQTNPKGPSDPTPRVSQLSLLLFWIKIQFTKQGP